MIMATKEDYKNAKVDIEVQRAYLFASINLGHDFQYEYRSIHADHFYADKHAEDFKKLGFEEFLIPGTIHTRYFRRKRRFPESQEIAHDYKEWQKKENEELNALLKEAMNKEAIKHDSDKLRFDLLPWDAITETVKVLNYGAKKYEDRNWEKGMNYSRLYAALQRHMTVWYQNREEIDPESGLRHLAHAMCCLLFLLAFELRKMVQWDDRPGKV